MCESDPTEEAMADVLPNGALESFDSSEFSLIPEQLPEQNGHHEESGHPQPGENGPHSAVLQAALMSATFDLSEEEIQKRLVELAEDNRSLRESLQSSSAIMKSELSAIASWHHSVTTTIAQHQIGLQEAQAKVQQLEKEKAELLAKIEEKDEDGISKAETAIVSDEDSEYEIIQKKSKDTESLKSQLQDSECKISSLKYEIEEQNLKIESMKNLFVESEKEKNDLKLKLENQDELKSKLCIAQKQIAESDLLEKANCLLKMKIMELEDQVQSHAPSPPMNDAVLRSQAEERKVQVDALKAGHENVVHDLEAKVKALEEKLDVEVREKELVRIKNQEDKKLLSVTQSNYDRVTKILQMQSRKEKQKTESMDCESRKSQEEIDMLTARLFDLEQRLEESQAKVEMLTGELNLAKEESEQHTILKAQVEVLKIDLDNAVLAKEAAHEELLQANQQLKELQEQVPTATFCSNCGAGSAHGESPSRGRHGKRRPHKQGSGSGPELYICPICQFGFTELQALENHVNTCLDKAAQ